jgi:hypothetical protein
MKHKHAELIKAWADGAQIQSRNDIDIHWEDNQRPGWAHDTEYRIKPETKPDVVDYVRIGVHSDYGIPTLEWARKGDANLKIIYDGETGRLKNAEVIA